MATERGKWLNHFGKKISIGSNESIPGLGSFFSTNVYHYYVMATSTRIFKHLGDHQD